MGISESAVPRSLPVTSRRTSAAWALLWEIWRFHRLGFLLVASVFVSCAVGYPLLPETVRGAEMFRTFCFVPMGISLASLFILFRFTESDRKERRSGFPARTFPLPISTWHLVSCPMAAAVGTTVVVYALWALLVYAPLGLNLPLGWPSAYLGAGMICFQSIVWSLSSWRIGRLVVLGIFGAFLAVGWILFRSDTTQMYFELAYSGSINWPVRSILLGSLGAASLSSYLLALASIRKQRRGGSSHRFSWGTLSDFVTDWLPSRTSRFATARAAHFWFEWRRNGIVLPISVASVLALITLPALFAGEVSAEMTMLCLTNILLLPLAIALALSKGFGKSDLWARNATLAPFVLLRPLGCADWVMIKLKLAGFSALVSWLITYVVTALWLLAFCDCSSLGHMWDATGTLFGEGKRRALFALLLLTPPVLTWRILIANLWIGASGRNVILTASVLLTFILGAIGLHVALWLGNTHHKHFSLGPLLPGIVWLLGIFLVAKVWFGLWAWDFAARRGLCTKAHIKMACAVWFALTSFFVLLAWTLNPQVIWLRNVSLLVALAAVPIARIAGSILALHNSRHHDGSIVLPSLASRQGRAHRLAPRLIGLGILLSVLIVALVTETTRSLPQRVDAGGHDVRILIQGQGGPAVVFESFGTATLEWWAAVQNRIAPFTTTVSYDHAGHGLSEPGPKPRDARTIARELHLALRNAGIPPPYLLVAHSFGGPYIRVFASLYPDDVCGMVLVDPSQENFFDWLRPRFPERNVITAEDVAQQEEWGCSLPSLDQARETVLPAVPVTLLTGMKYHDTVFMRQAQPRWLGAHKEWLSRQHQARHIVTTNSGHGIQVEEPGLVVEAIKEMLGKIRGASAGDE